MLFPGAADAQSEQPDSIRQINGVLFAHYRSSDKTTAMAKLAVVFDNHTEDFQLFRGAQRVEAFLIFEFNGKALTDEPVAMTLAFESRSSVTRLDSPESRAVKLVADGKEVLKAVAALDKTTVIGLVTWQEASLRVPLADVDKFLSASDSAGVQLGQINYSLTGGEFAMLRNFVAALRQAKQATQK
jgi:hypothetical protein